MVVFRGATERFLCFFLHGGMAMASPHPPTPTHPHPPQQRAPDGPETVNVLMMSECKMIGVESNHMLCIGDHMRSLSDFCVHQDTR